MAGNPARCAAANALAAESRWPSRSHARPACTAQIAASDPIARRRAAEKWVAACSNIPSSASAAPSTAKRHPVLVVLQPRTPDQEAAGALVALRAQLGGRALDDELRVRGGVVRSRREEQLRRVPGTSRSPQRVGGGNTLAVTGADGGLGDGDGCSGCHQEQRGGNGTSLAAAYARDHALKFGA